MTNEHNIESQFNACMHKEYCLSLKAQIRPLDENALAHTINMMPWRTDDIGPKLREFAEQLWTQFCSVPAAATAPASTQDEPFGYFRAEPFGWTDCAATDEGAIALYERPAAPAVPQGFTFEQLADACAEAGVSDSKFEAIVLSLKAATPAAPSQEPAVPQGNDPAWTLAAKVREALDRKACPGYYMDVAVEAVVHNYAPAAPSQPVTCGLCQGSGVLSPTQKCICQYGG